MVEVDGLMRGNWQLQEWRMPQPDRLELVAKMGGSPDARALVAAWEASDRFSDVTAEIGRNPGEVKIKATVGRASAGATR